MTKTPDILIDCDGVMGDTVGDVIALVNSKLGTSFKRDDVNLHEIFLSLGIPDKEYIWDDDVAYNNFCLKMSHYPEAKAAVKELQSFCNVYCVTAPGAVSPWMHERVEWLAQNMGIGKRNIIQTHAKYMVAGNMLIDDRADHIIKWKDRWWNDRRAIGVLFETPYATVANLPENYPAIVTNDWNKIIDLAKELAK